MKQGVLLSTLLLVFLTFFYSCIPNRLKDADVSNVQIAPVKILRLDQDVFSTKPDSFANATKKMQIKYGGFYNTFIFNVINHGEEHDSVYKALKFFVQDKDMKEVFNETQKIFTNPGKKKTEDYITGRFG